MTNTYFQPGSVQWLLGIEDTCVYPAEGSAMGQLDEHHLTGHDEQWREDFDRVAALGASGLRYGVSWPLIQTGPEEFDWDALDERFDYAVNTLGLVIIADLVHYGTPTWLTDSFADTRYPQVVAGFAGRFAERYRGLVDHITPLNEPLTTASFCGLRGVWPPALTGWAGWTTVTLSIVAGIRLSIASIREANPDATIVHVEAAAWYETDDSSLAADVAYHQEIARLPLELLTGQVDDEHSLWSFLINAGAAPEQLHSFTLDVPAIDLLGVNYYPDLTPRILRRSRDRTEQVTANRGVRGLRSVLQDAHLRYRLPLVITETSIEGTEDVRQQWLEDSAALIHTMTGEGYDIRGYTWWPLIDFVDWSYASGGRNVEEFVLNSANGLAADEEKYSSADDDLTSSLRRMGLLTLTYPAMTRVPTLAAASFAGTSMALGLERTTP